MILYIFQSTGSGAYYIYYHDGYWKLSQVYMDSDPVARVNDIASYPQAITNQWEIWNGTNYETLPFISFPCFGEIVSTYY